MKQVGKGKTNLRRYVKILLRIFTATVLIVLLLWTAIYIYFMANKASLLAKVRQTVNEKLRGDIQIKDIGLNFLINFPKITLRLDEVALRDSMYAVHHHELLKARKLFISSTTFQLLKGELHPSKIRIEDGQIYLFTDAGGYTNKYLTQPKNKDSSKSAYGSLPERIILKNVRLIYGDAAKQKLYDVLARKIDIDISQSGEFLELKTKLNAAVKSLAFNLKKGSYAKDKVIRGNLNLKFDTLQKMLTLKNDELRIGGQLFNITASFHFDSTKEFRLQLATNHVPFKRAASLLPDNIRKKLDSVDFAKPINVTADIIGRTVYRDTPLVVVKCSVKNNILRTPKGNFVNCSFSGSFTNQVSDTLHRNDENSAIRISGLKADWEGVPVVSEQIHIVNLIHPVITCDVQANTALSKMDELIGSESFQFTKGDARTKIYYHGPVGDSADVSPYISGSFSFSNADMEYLPRRIKLTNFTGDIIFDSSDIRLKELKGKVQESPIEINAEIKNFFALMDIDPGKLELNSVIYMPQLDVQQFKSFLGQRSKGAVRKRKARLAKLSRSIDRFMDQCNMNTTLKADKVSYKRFTATDVKANVLLTSNTWKFSNVSLNHADGWLGLDGALESVQGNTSRLNMNARLSNINISKLFSSFNNFGLDDISSKNIRGILNTNIRLTGIIDNNAAVLPSSLNGIIDLSLKKGELIDFEPLQKLSIFLLKKRDFSNLEFAELKNQFQLQGQSIIINRMEVQSTALSMYVEGLYDMKGDSTDLVIQVPLSNLKKRKPDYVPENKGIDAKTGMSVYVRAKSGKGEDIDFSFGLFKKKSVLEKRKLARSANR
jgi:hypothetical protein